MSHNIVYAIRVLFLLLLLLAAGYAFGAPMLEANQDGVRIVVYNEDCKLKAVVNLPKRATWEERGKIYEGCVGLSPLGLVIFYFDDKTAGAVPIQAFTPVTGA